MTDLMEMQAAFVRSKIAGKCMCWKCFQARGEMRVMMVVCPACGNKRCPHASDHALTCTGSNEPGQPGSVYATT